MADALPDLVGKVRLDTTDLEAGLKRASTAGSAIGSAIGGLAANGIAAGVQALGGFVRGTIDAGRESEAIGRVTAAIIKSTGSAAGLTAEQVGALAGRLAGVTGIDDEVIQGAENLLLTFKNVKNGVGEGADVFDRATGAALDLSKAGFGSVDGAAKMLGKALNDPLHGMTALSKAGVTFTDAQKEQVKALVASGDALGAQKIILKEVESQVGGVAAATATNADRAKVAFGNLQEDLASYLLPVIDRVAGAFANLAPKIGGVLKNLEPFIATAVMAFEAFFAALKDGDVTSDGLVGKFEIVGDAIHRALPTLKEFASSLLNGVATAARVVGDVLGVVGPVVLDVAGKLAALAGAIPPGVFEAVAVGVGVLTAAVVANNIATSIAATVKGVAAAATGLFAVVTNVETGATERGAVARLAHNVATVAGTVATVASTVARGIATAAQIAWTAATVVATGAATAFRTAALLLNAAFLANPFVAVAVVLAALVAGIVVAYQHSETFRNVVDTAFRGIKTVVGNVVGFMIEAFAGLLEVWITVAGGILGAAATAFSWVPGVGDKLESANKAFKTYSGKALDTLGDMANKAYGLGEDVPEKTASGINAKAGVATRAAGGMRDDVNGSLKAIGTAAYTAGANAGQGLVNGLDSYAGRVAASAQRLAIIAGKAMATGLQERSPSRVTMRIGAYAGEGLALGMLDTLGMVETAAGALASAAAPDVEAMRGAALGAGAAGGAAGGGPVSLTSQVIVQGNVSSEVDLHAILDERDAALVGALRAGVR
jgi:hypothetical protein